MKRDLVLLTTSQLLFGLADSLLITFGIIFFYVKFGNSFILAAIPFIALHLLHAFLLPILIKHVIDLGVKRAVIISIVFYVLAAFLVFTNNDNLTIIVMLLWALLYALGNVFYYVPTMYILGKDTNHKTRGRIFGLRRVLTIIINIILPILGGLLSQNFGLAGLMLISIVFYIISLLPLMRMTHLKIVRNAPLKEILKSPIGNTLVVFKFVQSFAIHLSDYWPILVFILVGANYSNLGILFTGVSFISIVVTYGVGKLMDSDGRIKYLNIASIMTPVSWLIRVFAVDPLSILIADSIFNVNNNFHTSVMDVVDFDLMIDHEVAEKKIGLIILGETVLNYFIALGYLVFAVMITYFGFYVSMVFSAILIFFSMQYMKNRIKTVER